MCSCSSCAWRHCQYSFCSFASTLIIHISLMAIVEPVPVSFVLALIPVVIVLVVRIVDAPCAVALLLFVTLVIVLGRAWPKLR